MCLLRKTSSGRWNTPGNSGFIFMIGHTRHLTMPPAKSRSILGEIAYRANKHHGPDTAAAVAAARLPSLIQ